MNSKARRVTVCLTVIVTSLIILSDPVSAANKADEVSSGKPVIKMPAQETPPKTLPEKTTIQHTESSLSPDNPPQIQGTDQTPPVTLSPKPKKVFSESVPVPESDNIPPPAIESRSGKTKAVTEAPTLPPVAPSPAIPVKTEKKVTHFPDQKTEPETSTPQPVDKKTPPSAASHASGEPVKKVDTIVIPTTLPTATSRPVEASDHVKKMQKTFGTPVLEPISAGSAAEMGDKSGALLKNTATAGAAAGGTAMEGEEEKARVNAPPPFNRSMSDDPGVQLDWKAVSRLSDGVVKILQALNSRGGKSDVHGTLDPYRGRFEGSDSGTGNVDIKDPAKNLEDYQNRGSSVPVHGGVETLEDVPVPGTNPGGDGPQTIPQPGSSDVAGSLDEMLESSPGRKASGSDLTAYGPGKSQSWISDEGYTVTGTAKAVGAVENTTELTLTWTDADGNILQVAEFVFFRDGSESVTGTTYYNGEQLRRITIEESEPGKSIDMSELWDGKQWVPEPDLAGPNQVDLEAVKPDVLGSLEEAIADLQAAMVDEEVLNPNPVDSKGEDAPIAGDTIQPDRSWIAQPVPGQVSSGEVPRGAQGLDRDKPQGEPAPYDPTRQAGGGMGGGAADQVREK